MYQVKNVKFCEKVGNTDDTTSVVNLEKKINTHTLLLATILVAKNSKEIAEALLKELSYILEFKVNTIRILCELLFFCY